MGRDNDIGVGGMDEISEEILKVFNKVLLSAVFVIAVQFTKIDMDNLQFSGIKFILRNVMVLKGVVAFLFLFYTANLVMTVFELTIGRGKYSINSNYRDEINSICRPRWRNGRLVKYGTLKAKSIIKNRRLVYNITKKVYFLYCWLILVAAFSIAIPNAVIFSIFAVENYKGYLDGVPG
jgi:hypothetical protein